MSTIQPSGINLYGIDNIEPIVEGTLAEVILHITQKWVQLLDFNDNWQMFSYPFIYLNSVPIREINYSIITARYLTFCGKYENCIRVTIIADFTIAR